MDSGSHVVAIDENEQELLGRILRSNFPEHTITCISVVHNKKGIQGDYFSYMHEFAYFCLPPALDEIQGRPLPEDEWEWDNLRKWGRESERATAKNCFYPILVRGERIIGFGDVCNDTEHPGNANIEHNNGSIVVYPIDSKGVERKWRYARNSVEAIQDILRVHTTRNGEIQIEKARTHANIKTVWDDSRYIAGDYGTTFLTNMAIKPSDDLYPKSVYTVSDSIVAVSSKSCTILDYFAGSGTTAHAVINLNREDGGHRKYILIEMANYFETVLIPRIKKVVYSDDWKNGKPQNSNGISHFMKYQYLEQYEDTLDNIEVKLNGAAQTLFGDDYLLKYFLDFETRDAPSFLSIDSLKKPFTYKLKVNMEEAGEPQEMTVDIPETFNYLLGLRVCKVKTRKHKGRTYRFILGEKEGRNIAVVWREYDDTWTKADFTDDKEFITGQLESWVPAVVYINGQSVLTPQLGAHLVEIRQIEPEFKTLMGG